MSENKQKATTSVAISASAKQLLYAVRDKYGLSNATEAVDKLCAIAETEQERTQNPTQAADLDEIAKLAEAIKERAGAMVSAMKLDTEKTVEEANERADAAEQEVKELKKHLATIEFKEKDYKRIAELNVELEEQLSDARKQLKWFNGIDKRVLESEDKVREAERKIAKLEKELAVAETKVEMLSKK